MTEKHSFFAYEDIYPRHTPGAHLYIPLHLEITVLVFPACFIPPLYAAIQNWLLQKLLKEAELGFPLTDSKKW